MLRLGSGYAGGTGLLLLLLLLWPVWECRAQTVCNNNDNFGEGNPGNKENRKDNVTGVGFLMLDTDIDIDCCGVAEKWEAQMEYRTLNDVIYFQVWRPVTGGYELIGQTAYTPCCSTQYYTITIAQPDRYTVKSGDVMGWYTPGQDMVKYAGGGGGNRRDDNMLYSGIGTSSIGDLVDWTSTATNENNRDYGIRLDVRNNTDPSFDNLPDSTTITSSVGSAISITTVSASDIDFSDEIVGLTYDWVSNSQFSYDTTTHLLETGTLKRAPSTQRIVFTVADQCGNTVTSMYTVIITNLPPTLVGLPAATTISEDETSQTLVYTITCTDPTSDTLSSGFTLATTLLGYPFVIQQIPSTTDYGVYNVASPGFDYDIKTTYSMDIECTDTYGTDTGTVNVYLVDNHSRDPGSADLEQTQNAAPIVTNIQAATSISTGVSIGHSVFNITTTDAEGDTLT